MCGRKRKALLVSFLAHVTVIKRKRGKEKENKGIKIVEKMREWDKNQPSTTGDAAGSMMSTQCIKKPNSAMFRDADFKKRSVYCERGSE